MDKKPKKETLDLNHTLDQMDLPDVCKISHPFFHFFQMHMEHFPEVIK